MNNLNKLKEHIVYLLIIILFLIVSEIIIFKAATYQQMYFKPIPFIVLNHLVHYIFGIFISYEKILKEINNNGKWKINNNRLLILGLPILYISVFPLFYYVNLNIYGPFFQWILTSNFLVEFSQILFGFILTTSFYKEENK